MKNEDKTKAELIKELKFLREEQEEGAFKHITKLKQTEEAIQESENRFRELFTRISSGVAIYETKDNGKDFIIKNFNRAGEKIDKIKKKDIIGKSVLKAFPGVKDFGLFKVFQEVYKTGKPQHHPISLYKDQRIAGWRENYVYKLPSGEIVAVYDDITERKQAEEEIKSAAVKWQTTFDAMNDAVSLIDNNGIVLQCNQSYLNLLGKTETEILGKHCWEIVHGTNKPIDGCPFMKMIKSLQRESMLLPVDDKWFSVAVDPIFDANNNLIKAVHIITDITERKQAEEKLQDSEERLKILFDYAPDAYYIHDLKGNFIDGNLVAEKIIGRKREELIGNNFLKLKLLSAKDMPKATKSLAKNIMGLPTGPEEYVLNRKDKSTVTVEISNYPVKIKGKTLVLGIARDITERKKAESERQIERDKLTAIFESMADGVYIVNKDYDIQYVNPVLQKTFGSPEGKKCHEYFHDSDEPCTFCKNEEVFAGKTVRWEWASPKDGKTYDLIDTPIKNADGSISKLEIFRDISERKQAEEVLRQSEEKHRGIFDESIAAIYLFDVQKNFIDSNQAGLDLLGYTRKELLKMSIPDVDADTEAVLPAHKKLLAGDRIVNYEHQLKRKDGSIINVLNNSRPLIDIDGNVVGMQSTLIDITERKQAEENVKNAKDELQMIMDSVPALIIYKDTEGRIIRANKTLADRLEIPVKDIVGKTTEELFPKEEAENMRKDDKEVIISGKPKRDIIQPYTTPDGIRWTITDKIPYKDKEGKIIGVIAFAKDITVQKKSEEELQQSYQRLKKTMDATIDTMSKMIEAKDPYTSGHQHRVCQLAIRIAQEMKLSEDKIEEVRITSLIHDIGKIGLPTEILSKPSTLTDIEFSLIRNHSQIGYDILKSINFPFPIAQIVLQHHERLNGTGYPNNLKGDEILLKAKIIGIADVVEAMSSHRPYRPALGINAALEEISQNKGVLYDPEIVDTCIKLFKEKGFKFE